MSAPIEHDVLVVGAGPAGATAARVLAEGGLHVCLIDRHRFPRNKPCGGGLTARALGRFPWLEAALARIPTHRISRLHLEGPSGRSVVLTSPEPAVVMVRRLEFDHLLVDLAVEAGAALHELTLISGAAAHDDRVTVTARDGRSFTGRDLVVADGVNGVLTRRLGLHAGWAASSVALDMMEEAPTDQLSAVDPETLWVSYGHGGTEGYGYIFPKRDHVNVGVGCLLSCFREQTRLAPYEVQRRFVEDLCARQVLRGTSSRARFTPYRIPVGGPIRETARGRVLVAGDAGGFVNAYTAEGIYYAMVSGELAGRAILESLRAAEAEPGDRAARRYERAWRREIGVELRDALLIQKYFFRDARRVEGVIRGAEVYPAVADMIIAYATGRVSYLEARRRLLSRFPRVMVRLARIALFG